MGDPAWVRFLISGRVVSAYYRETPDASWRFLGADRVTLGSRYEVGLAVSGVNDGTLGRGTFDNVTINFIPR